MAERVIAGFVRRHVYGRKTFQSFFRKLHSVSLGGMNYGNVGVADSGEIGVLRMVRAAFPPGSSPVILDVGANSGQYAMEVMSIFGDGCLLHSFEPSPSAFARLSAAVPRRPGLFLHNVGLAAASGELVLHCEEPGGTGSSLVAKNFPDGIHNHSVTESIVVETLDEFCASNAVDRIDLLKLDVEGGELDALRGGARMLASGNIPYIQFEYGEASVGFRTFLRDFHALLRPQYRIHRVLCDGLEEQESYTLNNEIALTANYLAVAKGAYLPPGLAF